jgi:electron transfer flavoprotein beta subunit
MKILVSVKRVPDPYGRIALTKDGKLDTRDVKWVINPFDEIAIEEAVRLREAGNPVEIVAVSVGSEEYEPTLRAALAMGADRAVLIETDSIMDAGIVTHLLAAMAAREAPDLIFMGKQAIDDDQSQIGPRLAARLKMPQVTFASSVTLLAGSKRAQVIREVDAGQETLEVALPAVITADLRLNTPRYVALPAILKARSKPLQRVPAADLGPMPECRLRVVEQVMPPPRRAGRRVNSVEELFDALHNEARVI